MFTQSHCDMSWNTSLSLYAFNWKHTRYANEILGLSLLYYTLLDSYILAFLPSPFLSSKSTKTRCCNRSPSRYKIPTAMSLGTRQLPELDTWQIRTKNIRQGHTFLCYQSCLLIVLSLLVPLLFGDGCRCWKFSCCCCYGGPWSNESTESEDFPHWAKMSDCRSPWNSPGRKTKINKAN